MSSTKTINFSVLNYYKKANENGPNTSKLDTFGSQIFKSNFIRSFLKFGRKWQLIFRYIILALIFTHSVLIRQFAYIRFGNIIHEFDPHFNLRATQYLETHGLKAFWNWFDEEAWYPLGRAVGHTIFPGMMITAYFIHQCLEFFGLHISINNVCVFIGPLFSGFTSIVAYLSCVEMTGNTRAGLLAAFFISISPSYISRSVAGSYDNEAVAIFALAISFYTWMKAINTGTLLHTLLAALCTSYMVSAWGGYVFVVNTIAVFCVVLALLDRLGAKIHTIYTSYYLLVTVLLLTIPTVSYPALKSSEHMGPHFVFILTHAIILAKFAHTQMPIIAFKKLAKIFSYTVILFFVILFVYLSYTGKTTWSGRSRTLLDPTYASNHHPLIASISEHQSPSWTSYAHDIGIIIAFCPIGIYLCLKSNYNSAFFIAIYAILSLYFSGIMVRLLLVVAPAASYISAIGISYLLENLFNFLRPPSLHSYVKADYESKKKIEERAYARLSPIFVICITSCISFICLKQALNSTWMSSEAYSNPTVVSYANHKGLKLLQDDFREAFAWLRYNTHPRSRIFSWWDYGYQTSSMANRTVIVDNNTRNHTQIATVGLAFSSNEENAYQILNKYDVDYVLVVSGSVTRYNGDDINKFLWMIRIAGGDYLSVQLSDYTKGGYLDINSKDKPAFTESIMYKMCYNKVHKVNGGFDVTRRKEIATVVDNLEYFEEVFTSENYVVRIYKLKKEPNFIGVYATNTSREIQSRILNESL